MFPARRWIPATFSAVERRGLTAREGAGRGAVKATERSGAVGVGIQRGAPGGAKSCRVWRREPKPESLGDGARAAGPVGD